MRKRDRTSDEKAFDANLKNAIMHLGKPREHEEPIPFPYVFAWDRFGRKGSRCKVLRDVKFSRTVQVMFEDGAVMVVNRMAVRRN